MSAISESIPRKLDVGRVLSDTFLALGRSPALYFGLAFLLGGVPSTILQMISRSNLEASGAAFALSPAYWLSLVLMIFVGSFLTACLYKLTVALLSGETPTLREVLTTGWKFFLPMFGVNFLLGFAVAIGFLLLVVPGLMLLTAWCVVGPVLINERTNLMGVFGRSAELTRGNRWRIVGLFAILFIGIMIIEAILGALGLAAGLGRGGAALLNSTPMLIGGVLFSTVLNIVMLGMVGALYVQLRDLKGGTSSERLTEVFS